MGISYYNFILKSAFFAAQNTSVVSKISFILLLGRRIQTKKLDRDKDKEARRLNKTIELEGKLEGDSVVTLCFR